MGMIICPIHKEQVVGFVSAKVGETIQNELVVTQPLFTLTITDNSIGDIQFSQLVFEDELNKFLQMHANSQFFDIGELNQLSIPKCGKCIRSFLERNNIFPEEKEVFMIFTE